MADKDTIAALMAGMGGGSSVGSLRDTIIANDIYRQAAAPVLQARFDNSTWTPKETLGVSAGQAFLGALLTGLGKRDEAAQYEKIAQVLPQLRADPMSVAVPEGVDSEAFNILKINKIMENQTLDQKMREDISKRNLDVLYAGEKAKTEAKNSILGKNEAYGTTEDPDSPSAKSSNELAKQLVNNKEVVDLGEVRNRIQVLQKAALDPTSVADLDYVIGVAKILDPTSVVRESEGQTVIDSQSMSASVLGQLNKAIAGKSAIDRASLFNLAKRHFDTRASRVNDIADYYGTLAKTKGANINDTLDFIREGAALKDFRTPVSVTPTPNTLESLINPDLRKAANDILVRRKGR